MRLTATDDINVYGRALKAGDDFECPDNEARTWILMGKAQQRRGPGRPRKDDPMYYHRADLRAEGE